ncbi:MAG TPA: DUF1570 domain-containing protein, partial [Brevundimonas sp.]
MFKSITAVLHPRLSSAASAVVLAIAFASPAHAEWLRAETEHFIIYGDTNRSEITRYATKLERFDSLLRTYFPIPVENMIPKLEIVLADGGGDMNRMSPGIGSSVAGFYTPDSGRIFAVVNTRSEMDDVVIFHEYAHHFMFQMTAPAYPSWFVEGFAEYFAQSDVRPDHLRVGGISSGRMRSLAVPANQWAPTADVLSWRISASGRYRGFDYYAQSWALTHYMMADEGRKRKLGEYLNLVKNGASSIEAFQTAFGRTPAQLQEDLRRYLLLGSVNVMTPQIELRDTPVAVTEMPPSYGRLVWFDFRLDRNGYKPAEAPEDATEDVRRRTERRNREAQEEQQTLIREALAEADLHPGDRMGLMVKSRAQRLAGHPSQAFDTLMPLLTATSTDPISLRLAGEILRETAQTQTDQAAKLAMMRQSSAYLARAMDADPLDFRIYLALDDNRQDSPGYPNANDLSTLEVASALAPQSSDARVRTARAYLAHDQPALAVIMLMPVVNNPHGGTDLKATRALLAQARAAAGMAPTLTDAPPPEDNGVEEGDGD